MKNGYKIHDLTSAPADSQFALTQVKETLGFIPNALAAMAESPVALASFMRQGGELPKCSFTDTERHLLYLTVTRDYASPYCVSAHTAFAQMDKVDDELVRNIREGKTIADKRLQTLCQFASKMVQTGCNVSEQDIQAFLDAGYTRAQILEVILIMTNKLYAVFANRIMGTDLDEALQPLKWSKVA